APRQQQAEGPKPTSGPAPALPASLYDDAWKDDNGWKKLDGGRSSDMPGSAASLSFQVRRRGGVVGGRPGLLFMVNGNNFVRFELSGDKLTWWVTQGANRDKKIAEAPIPKDVEDVRIDVTNDTIAHTIGGISVRVSASDTGFTSFAGGRVRFRGPIS